MAIIKQDFIGLFLGAPFKETNFVVGDKVKARHIGGTAGIRVRGNGDYCEIWQTAGLASRYKTLEKALKQKIINEDQFRKWIIFEGLYNFRGIAQYDKFITPEVCPWEFHIQEQSDRFRLLRDSLELLIYQTMNISNNVPVPPHLQKIKDEIIQRERDRGFEFPTVGRHTF